MTATRFRRTHFDFNVFAPRKPRHPLVRLAFGLLGLGLLLLLVFFSVFVGIAMLAAGVLYRVLRPRAKPVPRDARIVDGEFRVVGKAALPSA
jgi:UPF0716 family protein affecting phage T7 exclusion